jgi:hypothetical protein
VAIAAVAKGTTLKVDTSATAGPYNVALPAGHVSGHLILLFVTTDDNTSTTADPSGWTRLFYITNGSSVGSPYTPRVRTKCYYRIDNGSLGASVALTFDTTDTWPTGKPSVLAFTEAYSGCDTTGPIERWDFFSTTSTAVAQAHPQVTTTTANAWLLSFRAISSDSPGATFTCSVGTDAERADDIDAINELSCALYDSNTPLAAGLQTQRTTTASRAATYGGLAASIVLKPSGAASATPSPGSAEAIASALDATVTSADGPWSLCGVDGLPEYTFAVDWAGDGDLETPGTVLSTNGYFRYGVTGYTGNNSTVTWDGQTFRSQYGISAAKIVPNGSSASGGMNQSPVSAAGAVVAGNTYRVVTWAYSPAGWSDLRPAVDWYDASGVFIASGLGSGTVVPAGQWTRIEQSLVAPALASRFSLRARHGGTPAASDVWYVWGLLLVDPTTAGVHMEPAVGDSLGGLITSDLSISYGRDQTRQLNPAAVGNASFSVINVDRTYSPDFASSPLFGDLEPSQLLKGSVAFGGHDYPLVSARVDDYNIRADMTDRTVDFTFLDGLNDLQNVKLSTEVYKARRTGELIGVILDLVGWTGPRDLDLGATLVPYWWVEGTDALSAIGDLIKSEGPPSIAYQAPDGTFVFRDRHHRIQRAESVDSQATFAQPTLMDCDAGPLEGFDFTAPFAYAHGARDIINSVTFDVSDRIEDADLTVVWTQDSQISLSTGESATLEVSGSDPFVGAVAPVSGTDFTASGAGVPSVTLSRTSGASATITVLAIGGSVTVSGLQLRARTITVQRSIKVSRIDSDSITRHGEKSYPETAPWANANDADAIAGMILLHYARRRPTVQMRVTTQDPAHFIQCISRTVSDRIHIRYDEMGLDDDFYVESVQHTIRHFNQTGKPPVHAIVLGCEKDLEVSVNPFTFDKRGAGFDQGTFDPIQSDQPDTVFVFDHPVQGQFDGGLFGT